MRFILVIIISIIDCIVIKPLIDIVGIYLIQKLILLSNIKILLGFTRNSQSSTSFLSHLKIVRVIVLIDENSGLLLRWIIQRVHSYTLMRGVNKWFHCHYSFVDVTNLTIVSKMSYVLHKLLLTSQIFQVGEDFTDGIWKATFQASLLMMTRNEYLVKLDKEIFICFLIGLHGFS